MRKTYTKQDLGRSFGLTLLIMLIAQVMLSAIFGNVSDDEGNMLDLAYWISQALYSGAIGLTAFIYARATKTNFVNATSANKPPKASHFCWGVVIDVCLVAVMWPLNSWILQLLEKLTGNTYSAEMPMQLLPMLLVACVLPALAEEFTFRGTIAQSLKHSKSPIGALALSGALFALIHFNPAQTLHQFVLGAFLTLMMFRSGSIWTSVLVHLFNNVFVVMLSFVLTDESAIQPYFVWIFLAGLVCLAASVWGYLKTTQNSWKEGSFKANFGKVKGDKTDENVESGVVQNSVERSVGTNDVFQNDVAQSGVAENDVVGKAFFIISLVVGAVIWILCLVVPQ